MYIGQDSNHQMHVKRGTIWCLYDYARNIVQRQRITMTIAQTPRNREDEEQINH